MVVAVFPRGVVMSPKQSLNPMLEFGELIGSQRRDEQLKARYSTEFIVRSGAFASMVMGVTVLVRLKGGVL